jgi:LysR family transcriptional regulator, regulator for metE and metH
MQKPVNLEIGHFRLLMSLAEHGTLSRVAIALGLSQPAASYRLKEIERRVGVPVVERRNNKYRLNFIGERLLEAAEVISAELQRLQTEIESLRKGIVRTIRVSTHAYNCTRWLAPFLKEFRDGNEHLGVELIASSVGNPLHSLDNDISDVVIVAGQFSERRATCFPLFESELVGVVAPDHEFAKRDFLVGEDFRGIEYVTYSTTHEPGFEGDILFRPGDLYPGLVIRAGDSDSVLAMVEAGFGISVLGRWAVRDHEKSKRLLSKRLTADGIHVTWNALCRHRENDDGIENFCTSLADWCSREMQ